MSIRATATATALVALAAAGPLATAHAAPAGAPAGVSAEVQLAQSGVPAAVVADIQSLLNRLGYDAGPADGVMGWRTRSAIRAYQRAEELEVNGEPSYRLRAELRDSVQAAERPQEEEQEQAPAEAESDAELVTNIQARLRRLGYDVPVVSGKQDASTREAIRAYQRDHNLLVTGQATTALLDHIERTAGSQPPEFTDRETVRKVQAALNARGYNAGPADGVMGPSTRSAIRTYRADADMEISGRIDADLLASLDIQTAASPDSNDVAEQVEDQGETDAEPRYETAIVDEFDDGNFTHDPHWRIMAGSMEVTAEGWLDSRVEIPEEPKGFGDIGRQVLQGVMADALGINFPDARNVSAIATSVEVGNAFRARFTVAGERDEDGTFALGTYRGNNGQGYRVAAIQEGVRLMAVTRDGIRTIADTRAVDLGDGENHRVELHRDRDGSMWVVVDDRTVISAQDQTFKEPFDGIALINAGGHWRVDHVEVQSRVD